jgi:hypothetical protein
MPPLSARIPTVEFLSLLLPPVRIPLRALQSLHRPQCLPRNPTGGNPPQCLAQRRHLVLYKTARSETVLGQHKLLPFELYPIPPLGSSDQLVNIQTLADEQGRKTLVENITLQDAYDNYVKPGHLLILLSEITKKVAEKVETLKQEKTYLSNSTYGIVKAESIPSNIKSPTAGKGQGALRVTPVNLASTKSYFTLALDRSHQFIRHGSPVEFTIRLKGGYDKTTDKLEFQGHENWTWLHNHFPHLRPDFILKSMPEGSRFVVDPVSDGRVVQFVIAKQSPVFRVDHNLTARLFKIKEAVKTSIARGQQAQLPKRLRSTLQQAGHVAYSPMTGLPLNPKRKQEVYEKRWERNGDAFAEDTAEPSAHRYMPVQHFEDRSVGRVDKLTAEGNLRKRPTTGRPPQDGKPIKGSVKYGRGAERGSTQKNTIQGRLQRSSEGRPGLNSLEMLAGSTSKPKKANE